MTPSTYRTVCAAVGAAAAGLLLITPFTWSDTTDSATDLAIWTTATLAGALAGYAHARLHPHQDN